MAVNVVIYVVIVPFAVAAITSLAARRLRLAPGCDWALCIALAYIAGQVGLAASEHPAQAFREVLEPREAVQWLPHAVLLAAGIACIFASTQGTWRRLSIVLAAALSIGLPLRLLANSSYTLRWSLVEKLAYIALLGATFALTWLVIASAGERQHARLRPLLLIVVASGTAVVIALSGVFFYGELCGIVAAAITGATASAAADDAHLPRVRIPFVPLRPTPSPWRVANAAGVLACSLGGLIVLACFYGELSPLNATLLFVSLLVAGGRLPRFVTVLPTRPRAAIRIALSVLPLAIALARAITAAQASMAADPYAAM